MNRNARPQEWVATVFQNRPHGGGYFTLSLLLPPRFPAVSAGQFAMLAVGGEPEILLRRPMAFCDQTRKGKNRSVDILYAVVGGGTHRMSRLRKGDAVSLLGPIGNSFSTPKKTERWMVVAGGVGIAPFFLYMRQISSPHRKNVQLLLGFREKSQLSIARRFRYYGVRPLSAVEMGGGDLKGTVIDLMEREFHERRPTRILTCGPEKMMQRVFEVAKKEKIPCEASLEAKMGCGLGVCLSCVTDFRPGSRAGGYSLVCQDGPVFRMDRGLPYQK